MVYSSGTQSCVDEDPTYYGWSERSHDKTHSVPGSLN